MTNVIPLEHKKIYRSYPERELESMWEDIKGKNYQNLVRNLLKAIPRTEDKLQPVDISPHSKEMWDSKKNKYVPYNIWGAHYIVNTRKEPLVMRMYQELPYRDSYGDTIYDWLPYNCSSLEKLLIEKAQLHPHPIPMKKSPLRSKHLPMKDQEMDTEDWISMVKQDHQSYRDQGRYSELPGYTERGV